MGVRHKSTSALKRAIEKSLETPEGRRQAVAWVAQSDPAAARRLEAKWASQETTARNQEKK